MFKLLIGTRNKAKLLRWQNNLKHQFEIISLADCNINDEVEESLTDLIGNSQKKALFYARKSGIVTISDDTGFFINELNGLPGVAVRRWGGELVNDISDAEFLHFFKQKISNLKDWSAYFEYATSIASPEGKVETITSRMHGKIDQNKLNTLTTKECGYPLGFCFIPNNFTKSRHESTDAEKKLRDQTTVEDVIKQLKLFFRG